MRQKTTQQILYEMNPFNLTVPHHLKWRGIEDPILQGEAFPDMELNDLKVYLISHHLKWRGSWFPRWSLSRHGTELCLYY